MGHGRPLSPDVYGTTPARVLCGRTLTSVIFPFFSPIRSSPGPRRVGRGTPREFLLDTTRTQGGTPFVGPEEWGGPSVTRLFAPLVLY